MSSSFIVDPAVLENNLFTGSSGKKNRQALCANYLPHLFYYVKSLLTETERSSLKDYDVQVFLIELAIGQKKFTDLNLLCEYVIKEIRSDIKYWIKGTETFLNILSNMEQLGEDNTAANVISSMKEENEAAFAEYKEYHEEIKNIYEPSSEEEEEEESKTELVETETLPNITQYIPRNEEFDLSIYENVVDTFYMNKNEQAAKKRSTRLQEKRNREMLNYPPEVVKRYQALYKEIRDNDPCFNERIFVINRSNKIPRIDLQLFPLIFQFITKRYDILDEPKARGQVILYHRLQNLIYLCLMTDEKKYSYVNENRNAKAAFFDIEEERERVPVGDLTFRNDPLLEEFRSFAFSNGVDIILLFTEYDELQENKLNLLANTLKVLQVFIERTKRWELSIVPSLDIQDVTYDKFKMREFIMALEDSTDYTADMFQSLIDYYHVEFERKRLLEYIEGLYQYIAYTLKKQPENPEMQAIFSDKKFTMTSIENYIHYFNAPHIAKKRSYIFHTTQRRKLTDDECRKFLEGLLKYYDTPVNNKKIARHIGPHIKPNHIRFIKGKYLRQLRKRAKKANIPIRDMLRTDVETKNIAEVVSIL